MLGPNPLDSPAWESRYPDYPELLHDDLLNDCDKIFEAAANREGTTLFHAAILKRFCDRVWAEEPIEPWILDFLAEAFSFVLVGAPWDERFNLPGRELPDEWGVMPPKEQRDLGLFCDIENRRRAGEQVTAAIRAEAESHAVSYETARAAYYKWRDRLSDQLSKM